jgi:hypothetical protein
LEDRLRNVDGVASIRVELGDEGVDAIKVEVVPGADEAGVLEEIRKVLVSYGLRSRRPGWKLGGRKSSPAIIAEVPKSGDVDDLDTLDASGLPVLGEDEEVGRPVFLSAAPASTAPQVRVQQGGKGLIIAVTQGDRIVESTSDVSPIGAAEAMAKVVSEFHGLSRPDRVAVVMHELDGERVVTLLVRRGEESAVAVEVARPLLHDALYIATERAMRSLGQ